jgi:hypothetical protein
MDLDLTRVGGFSMTGSVECCVTEKAALKPFGFPSALQSIASFDNFE